MLVEYSFRNYVIKHLTFDAANYPPDVVDNLPNDLETGIYCGWAKVDDGAVYKMVMSVGWNPYFKNEKKSMVKYFHLLRPIFGSNNLNYFRKRTFFINLTMIFMGQI